MLLHFYVLGLVLLTLLPAAMMRKNLPLFRKLPSLDEVQYDEGVQANYEQPLVSVLIPARNEQPGIGECLQHVLACACPQLEVMVMDDASTDGTYAICSSIAERDRRLTVLKGRELPMGWNGKQRACWQLALAARGQWLLFIDADVRLSVDAIPRLVCAARQSQVDLMSGFPKQITSTWSEKLLIPLMHFILLGYLPIARMRASPGVEFAAGCGQLFFARRSAYMTCEGHKAISNSRHDGLKLPRVFRKQRYKTDIFDASDIATCRMYRSAREVVTGLLKNATEGIANPRTIAVFTLLLAGAAVMPLLSLGVATWQGCNAWIIGELFVASCISYLPRIDATRRFGQSWLGAILHPLGVLIFLILQWIAFVAHLCGVRVSWRGRS
jgi:glycosyltransferase involved in cell wall biosynthesis